MKSFLILSFLIFFISCNGSDSNQNSSIISPISGDEISDEFLSLVNNYRQDRGLRSLRLELAINEIALHHSQSMASAKVGFGHSGFSLRCVKAQEALGGGNLCLENVARGQRTAKEVFKAWVNSSAHRENIESSRATHMGLGYAQDNNGTYYWTQFFLER